MDVRILWLFNLHAIAGKNDSFRGNGTTREEKSASHREEDDLKHARIYTFRSRKTLAKVMENGGAGRLEQLSVVTSYY